MSTVDVQLRGVSKRYGKDDKVVHELDLDVEHSSLMTLLGPSGCGKTTTLKMISGFEGVTEGDIHIAGEHVHRIPAHKRNVSTVFQNYPLFPHMTVYNNVAFGLVRHGVKKPEIRRRVGEMLDMVGLADFAHRYPTALSGGQQQRVALARSLVLRPKVVLLDEPLSNLDAKLRKTMEIEIRTLFLENNLTAIHVTHDPKEALTMSDKIAVMNAGRIEQLATPEEIYRHPSNRWVAQFIGTSNILPITGTHAVSDGVVEGQVLGTYPVRSLGPAGAPHGDEAWLMLRPETVNVRPDGERSDTGGVNEVPAVVRHKIYLGRCVQLDVEVAGRDEHLTVEVRRGQDRIQVGDEVTLTWEPEDAWILES